jgi:hypothetical protein
MEYQHPRWQRVAFLLFSFFILLFPVSLILLAILSESGDDRESYLLGSLISLIIVMVPIELFAKDVLSSVAVTRKALIIRPGGLILRFFTGSRKYPFSDYLFFILMDRDEPVMADIYNFEKEIQAHIYHPRIRHLLLNIAKHEYLPNFHVSEVGTPDSRP